MTVSLLNRVLFRAASSGTGDFVVSAALPGYMTPAQSGGANGISYSYAAESDDKTEWEIGTGVYTTGTTTLTRVPIKSSNSNAKVNFAVAPKVAFTALAADLLDISNFTAGTLPDAQLPARLGIKGFRSVTDWKDVASFGLFAGNNAIDAPTNTGTGDWYVGFSEWFGDAGWGKLTAWSLTQATGADTQQYIKYKRNGTWEASWTRVRQSETELDARYVNGDGTMSLSAAQQGQARANIGAHDITGDIDAVINGDFEVTERANGSPTFVAPVSMFYPLDRWFVVANGTGGTGSITIENHTPGQTAVPGNPRKYLRWQITSAASGQTSGGVYIAQRIKDVRTYAGKKVTLTAYAKGSGDFKFRVYQNFGTGGSPSADVDAYASAAQSLGSSWTKYSFVFDMPSISGKTIGTTTDGYVLLWIEAPINTTFDLNLSHISLVPGDASAQADAKPRATFEEEEWRCLPFFCKTFGRGVIPAQNAGFTGNLGMVMHAANTNFGVLWRFPRPMVRVPTLVGYCPNAASANWSNAGVAIEFNPGIPPNEKGTILFASSPTISVGTYAAAHATADAEI